MRRGPLETKATVFGGKYESSRLGGVYPAGGIPTRLDPSHAENTTRPDACPLGAGTSPLKFEPPRFFVAFVLSPAKLRWGRLFLNLSKISQKESLSLAIFRRKKNRKAFLRGRTPESRNRNHRTIATLGALRARLVAFSDCRRGNTKLGPLASPEFCFWFETPKDLAVLKILRRHNLLSPQQFTIYGDFL